MLCTLILAGSAAFASATGRPWRSAAVRAAAVPLALTLGVVAVGVLATGGQDHPIHDVTTDLEDRLEFTPDVAALEQMPMTREQVLALQQETYPDIQPLQVELPVQETYERALAVAQGMEGWQVTGSDPGGARIEAAATSRIFRFVDDVAIGVTPDTDGSRVDVRSRSRMGRSDLGANAQRIRDFLGRLQEAL
jgi:uncharacterized protein (DUF1499 family)